MSDKVTLGQHAERVRVLAEHARRSQQALADTIATRDEAILDAADAGVGLGAIADAAGLARGTIQQRVAAAAGRRQNPDVLPKLPFERKQG